MVARRREAARTVVGPTLPRSTSQEGPSCES